MKNFRLFAFALLAASTVTSGQGFPEKSRPIHLVVPFGAGAGSDLIVRAYGRALTDQGGVTVVVENKAGAEGVIGVDFARQAAPDGYTVLYGNTSTHVLNAHMQPSLPYDPVADFIPITATNSVSLVLNAGPSTNFRTLKDLLDAARASPGKYTFAGSTTSTRLSAEMLAHMAKINLLSVPYKTQPQATMDLAGGQVDLLMTDASTALPYYAKGILRPLGVTGATRLSALPNVPTIREQGITDYEFSAWHAFFVPARTPPEIVDKLRVMLRDAAKSKYVRDALATNASDPMDMDTAELTALLKSDLERWGKLLRDMKTTTR